LWAFRKVTYALKSNAAGVDPTFVSVSWKSSQVCDPDRNTAFPAGSTKYLVFTVLCFNGPIEEPDPLETVKLTPLLATPPTVTTTFPVVAPAGTATTMLVPLQLVGTAAVPLNVTVLVPCVPPKFAPAIVTDAPTNPEVGFRLAMLGPVTAGVTVKFTPLLATPPTVTTTFPVVAPAGTAATILVALQLVAAAAVPLNVTVLVPCVPPKFAPVIVTDAPTNPDVGFRLATLGTSGFPPPGFEFATPLQPDPASASAASKTKSLLPPNAVRNVIVLIMKLILSTLRLSPKTISLSPLPAGFSRERVMEKTSATCLRRRPKKGGFFGKASKPSLRVTVLTSSVAGGDYLLGPRLRFRT
jgi:hypothetical protein